MYSNNEDNKYKIAPELLQSLLQYAKDKIPTGSFLRAVLENDLMQAMGRADLQNRHNIFYVTEYIFNELPYQCWGSKKTVATWLGE